jgi:DNA-binding response OmpR family regulator
MKTLIFFAEDDPLMSGMYVRAFKLDDFDLKMAYDGEEAINTLKAMNPKPTVAILDIMMPKKSGFDVLKEMKENPELKNIPVILLTNLSGEKDMNKARELGANLCLVKSQYISKEIVMKVREIVTDIRIKEEFRK